MVKHPVRNGKIEGSIPSRSTTKIEVRSVKWEVGDKKMICELRFKNEISLNYLLTSLNTFK